MTVPPANDSKLKGNSGDLAIEASNLMRQFGNVVALNDVSLSIRSGEFFSLLGPSGCGKTTLLRIIAGLERPDSGSLRICSEDAQSLSAHRRPVNTVFQNYALFPHLSIWDNVAFGLRMKKIGLADIKSRVGTVLKLVEATELADRKPHQISGGQKQRVALARAIVNEPKVLLLDEPLGALDLKLRKQLQVQLHELQRRVGITFIYVTHDQEEALVMSDRIAVMNRGRIEQLDSPEALYEKPRTRFVAEFLGSCNVISGIVNETKSDGALIETEFGMLATTETLPRAVGANVSIGVRPEKISIESSTADRSNNANQFIARVESKVYSGAETQLRVRCGNLLLSVVRLNGTNHRSFNVGDSVAIRIPASAVLMLED